MAGIRDLFGLYYWLNNEKRPLLEATLAVGEPPRERKSVNLPDIGRRLPWPKYGKPLALVGEDNELEEEN